MWVFLNDCFLSIVHKHCEPHQVLVRARRLEHIAKVFPGAKITRSTDSDYMYRTVVDRKDLAAALLKAVDNIDYPNFKDTVKDPELRQAYTETWAALAELQSLPPWSDQGIKGGKTRR